MIDQGLPSGGLNPYPIKGSENNLDHYPLKHLFVLGDMDVNGELNVADINPFIIALSNPTLYQATYHLLPSLHGDINQDGVLDFGDINPFNQLLTNGD